MNWQELSNASFEEILAWAERQPWCQSMADCPQDDRWHAEGDVWTHAQMVCHQLVDLGEWATLTSNERTALTFTALLHDVAKPLTLRTDPVTGQISSPQHAVRGEQLARAVLRDLGCNLETRELIARLVRFHGRPAFLLERPEPTHEVVRLSWLVSNRLLYLFSLADNRGRHANCLARPEENLHWWKILAEENACYDRPYPFVNDHARFLFFRQQEPSLHYVPHEAFACDVTMVSGLPGSGKDTWLVRNRGDLPVVSLDDIRRELAVDPTDDQGGVTQLARERCRQFLRNKTSFAFNATNIARRTRRRWIDLFAAYDARIELVYLEPPFERLLSQNRRRAHSVPEQIVCRLAASYEPPTPDEAHAVILAEGDEA